MIGNILNLQIENVVRTEPTTTITITFDIPNGTLGAYALYGSTNTNVFKLLSIQVDSIYADLIGNTASTTIKKLNYKIYFSYTIPSTDNGKTLYFKMHAISPYQEKSDFTDVFVFNNYCTPVTNVQSYYDNFNVGISWDAIDTSNNLNANLKDYVITREGVVNVTDMVYSSDMSYFSSPDLLLGNYVWVIDNFNRSYWCGLVTSTGFFNLSQTNTIQQSSKYTGTVLAILSDTLIQISPPLNVDFSTKAACLIDGSSYVLSSSVVTMETQLDISSTSALVAGQTITLTESVVKINDVSNLTTTLNPLNLLVYMGNNSPIQIGNVTTNSYIDDSFDKDTLYIYKVYSRNIDGTLGTAQTTPVYTISLLEVIPYLRHPNNSNMDIINQIYWKNIKNALVDDNYYLMNRFDLPYLDNTPLHLKGFLGVAECNLDIFINDIYNSTILTDSYGEFDFYYTYSRGQTTVKFQARDSKNIDFSMWSTTNTINTLNAYTALSIFSGSLIDYLTELSAIRTDNNIDKVRYSTYIDEFAPLTNFYKDGSETDESFLALATTVFDAYYYAGYYQGVKSVLDAFVKQIPEFDHYEIYDRYSLYQTDITGRFFVPQVAHTNLQRTNYYYGVSSVRNTGEESTVSSVRVDNRWWPFNYKGYNAFMWDEVATADYYKIYRGVSLDTLQLLSTTKDNIFIDNGDIVLLTNTEDYDTIIDGGSPLDINTSIIDEGLPSDINTLILDEGRQTTINTPMIYNYSGMNPPSNFNVYLRTKLSQLIMLYKQAGNIIIMLFAKDDEVIPDFQFSRLTQLFTSLIPPELRITTFLIKDSSIYIYQSGVGTTITNNVTIDYGSFDISHFDSNAVFN